MIPGGIDMSLFYIPLAVLCLWGIKYSGKAFRGDAMSVTSTTAINGIFTVLVFMCYTVSWQGYRGGTWDDRIFTDYLYPGQLVVVPFLFFSGYGIAESLRRKPGYAKRMPRYRLGKVWLSFAAALVLYLAVNLLMGKRYTPLQIVLAFTGWGGFGNSNWFMFDILCLYALTYIAFLCARERFVIGAALTSVFSVGLIAALWYAGRDSYWWNTILFYPLGMWYSLLRPAIEKRSQRNNLVYWGLLVCAVALFAATHILYMWRHRLLLFLISGCLMMAVILLVLMKFTICNKALLWIGKNMFWIYILQRLPMLVLAKYCPQINKFALIFSAAACTAALTWLFSRLFDTINSILFGKNK